MKFNWFHGCDDVSIAEVLLCLELALEHFSDRKISTHSREKERDRKSELLWISCWLREKNENWE